MTTTQIGMIPIDQLTDLQRVRSADRDIPALVESIERIGIIEPLVVIPDDRGPDYPMLVIAGNRRLAAAKKAGLTEVPCYIRDGITSEARLLEAQLAENTQRDPLTVKEETLAWQALELAGMSTTDIGKAAGRKKSDVDKRLKVMTLPETTRARVWDGQITLEEADTLAEFADDPEALAWLEKYVGTTSFSWKKREWPREKARRAEVEKAREQAKAEKAKQKAAEEAAVKAGKPLPKPKPAPKEDTWAERQKREQAERDRIEQAAEIARDVRWPWLRDLIQAEVKRKAAIPDRLGSIAQMALARIVDARGGIEVSEDLLAWVGLGGIEDTEVARKATPMQALIVVLAAAAELDNEFTDSWSWRNSDADGRWLYRQLVDRFAYPISDEERALAGMPEVTA